MTHRIKVDNDRYNPDEIRQYVRNFRPFVMETVVGDVEIVQADFIQVGIFPDDMKCPIGIVSGADGKGQACLLSPDNARALAQTLIELADDVEAEKFNAH